jgi:hypothetical protein
LGAGCDSENSECDRVAHDPVRDSGYTDGIEGVGNREDPGSKGNESPPDAIWIAGSVPSFVVVGHEDGGLSEEEEWFEQ